MQKSGETVEFVYNENGLRVQKTATSTGVTKYTLHGKNIVHMTQGSNELHFFYDAQNKPAVVVYNGVPYSYVKNLQGDIVAILDSSKNVVVSYVYDAWGRPISCFGIMASTLGKINPFRYRGYVYDEETGLYYLRSRYYDTAKSRFSNADILYRGSLFSYCHNNSVNNVDENGLECQHCGNTHMTLEPTPDNRLYQMLGNAAEPKMTLCQYLAFMKQMESDKWKYAFKYVDGKQSGISYGVVDCVGIYRFAATYYYNTEAITAYGITSNNVPDMYTHAIVEDTRGVIGPDTELRIGMALFRTVYEEGEEVYKHVAFYVGDYFEGYSNAVIEATVNGVKIRSLEESESNGGRYTRYGYLKGVDYSGFD